MQSERKRKKAKKLSLSYLPIAELQRLNYCAKSICVMGIDYSMSLR